MVGLLLLAWFLIKWFKFCHYIYIIKKFQMIKLLGFQGIRYADLVFFFPSQSLDNLLMGCCFSGWQFDSRARCLRCIFTRVAGDPNRVRVILAQPIL